jgi:predicted  nucleic acid-binding Zn-ribbon protein
MMEELCLLRELCAAQDEKYKERVTQLEQELLALKGHVENLQSLVRESEDRENKLSKKVAEKAQAQKQMRYEYQVLECCACFRYSLSFSSL